MKKKGFTLIELIVVIAIIGVLAAILVPAMLGYVKKSKITSANSSAKSISTACQSALTDMDTQDKFKIAKWDGNIYSTDPEANWETTWPAGTTVTPAAADSYLPTNANNGLQQFEYKVYTYFKDITKLTALAIHIVKGNCEAVVVVNGNYPGANPTQFSVDDYNSSNTYGADWDTDTAGSAVCLRTLLINAQPASDTTKTAADASGTVAAKLAASGS